MSVQNDVICVKIGNCLSLPRFGRINVYPDNERKLFGFPYKGKSWKGKSWKVTCKIIVIFTESYFFGISIEKAIEN